ncbi:MAG: 23S rRNA (guanosine(2251)-2'-O)-methyltransferase RlmB [Methyloligellaceae bacterium]
MVKIKLTKKNRPPRQGRRRQPGSGKNERWLYGHHAVVAALQNSGRTPERLLATPQAAARLREECPAAAPEPADREAIERVLPPGAVHQGLALLASPLEQPALADAIAETAESALVVLLDQVTDPQNVGAILRSAAAFGADAVIMPQRHAPAATGALAKAASGALERVPLVSVANLAQALESLKQAGFWCVGLDAAASTTIAEADMTGRLALVLGAEGSGLRRLTAERCDLLVRLPTQGPVESLNVSNAAAVALYALTQGKQP